MYMTKIRWMTRTAAMLAMLLALQWAGSQIPEPMTKQLITGTCVNCVLAVCVLVVGLWGGVTLALVSPVFAFLWGISPTIITVFPIMLGNLCFVLLLRLLTEGNAPLWRQTAALTAAAVIKFLVLYALVVKVVCNLAAPQLMGQKLGEHILLAPKLLKNLPVMFSWPQLVTAFCGGGLALLITPTLKKAIR